MPRRLSRSRYGVALILSIICFVGRVAVRPSSENTWTSIKLSPSGVLLAMITALPFVLIPPNPFPFFHYIIPPGHPQVKRNGNPPEKKALKKLPPHRPAL